MISRCRLCKVGRYCRRFFLFFLNSAQPFHADAGNGRNIAALADQILQKAVAALTRRLFVLLDCDQTKHGIICGPSQQRQKIIQTVLHPLNVILDILFSSLFEGNVHHDGSREKFPEQHRIKLVDNQAQC